jgi:DNA polymerase-3 subunit epsilon
MYAILDIETTGLSASFEKITEIAVFIHDGDNVVHEFSSLVNPERVIPTFITRLTGIDNAMVENAPKFYEIAKELIEMMQDKIIVAHNAHFDYSFIKQEFKSLGYNFNRSRLCTVRLARRILPGHRSYSLGNICRDLNIKIEGRHRAAGDALATVKLFETLLTNDAEGIIVKTSKTAAASVKLPGNVSNEVIASLPESAGVYYFLNEQNDIIYIGKSSNIRKRVLSHFAEGKSHKTIAMNREVCDINYELTGSELVALLLESDEIKKHKPRYNRSLKESFHQFGIFKSTNEDGYITFSYSKLKGKEQPLMIVRNSEEANHILTVYCEKFKLCPKLCGLHDVEHSCLAYHTGNCKGACIGKEFPQDYNKRAIQLIRRWRFENQNFFIIGEGRTVDEHSIVAVEGGKYVGFGYMDNEFEITNPEQLKLFIKNYDDNRDAQRIIRRHLEASHRDKIVNY